MTRTRIKFCGLTRTDDVHHAIELGVDYVGLVFAPRSPRKLLLGQARMLRERVPAEIGVVALVMDNSQADIRSIVENVQPDLLQFHGGEDDDACAVHGVPFLKAIAMAGNSLGAASAMAKFPSAFGYLLDGHAVGEQGGSGQRFDWKRVPADLDKPFFLAGGLSADNVGLAIRTARPWGVDVSSGIEAAPGMKNIDLMRRFVEEVRRADKNADVEQDDREQD